MQCDILLEGVRKRSAEDIPMIFSLWRASLKRILKKDVHQYPYKIQMKHERTPADMVFLVSVINHYHINDLYLFWDSVYL